MEAGIKKSGYNSFCYRGSEVSKRFKGEILKMKILFNVKKRVVVSVTIVDIGSINYKIYSISEIMKQKINNFLNL